MKRFFVTVITACGIAVCTMGIGSSVAQAWDDVPENWVHRVHSVNGYWYDLYIPYSHLLQEGKTYPMVLALHGCCASSDNDPGRVVVGVDPIYRMWHGYGSNTQTEPTWIVAPQSSGNWDTKRAWLFEIMDDLIEEFPIDTQRIIVTGFSMGGRGCFTYAEMRPDFFSAMIPIAAAMGHQSTDPDAEFSVANVKDIPTWGGCCADDSWCTNHQTTVGPVRAAHGYTGGNNRWVAGVNPVLDLWDEGGHGPAMGFVYESQRLGIKPVEWALTRINDGNPYPNVWFTSHEYNDTIDAGLVRFSVDARDNSAITRVDFYLENIGRNNRQVVATATQAPWEADIWISGERMPIFRIYGSVNVWARAYDDGADQGFAMNKYATDAIQLHTYGPATQIAGRSQRLARGSGMRHVVTPKSILVLLDNTAPAKLLLLRPDGSVAYSAKLQGAAGYTVARNALGRGHYVILVMQQGKRIEQRVVLAD